MHGSTTSALNNRQLYKTSKIEFSNAVSLENSIYYNLYSYVRKCCCLIIKLLTSTFSLAGKGVYRHQILLSIYHYLSYNDMIL